MDRAARGPANARTRVLLFRLLPVVAAMTAIAVALGCVERSSAIPAGAEALPDLDQAAPYGLVVSRARVRGRGVYRLGFNSAVRNVGVGPLIITGHRSSVSRENMVADQLVMGAGGPQQLISDVGRLRYVVSPDHRHWHYLGFDHYQLRRAG